ncbi:anaphase-promoting complex, subunit 10-domain-containing protein [Xylariaceae sp. FL0255]|nr:anaphase-promoting complex, subunit 10-domain-containing protein [Xylariaceae sp. FL0255]
MNREPNDPDDSSPYNQLNHRQGVRSSRWRLLRSHHPEMTQEEAGPQRTPQGASVDADLPFDAPLRRGQAPDRRWAFQTPEGLLVDQQQQEEDEAELARTGQAGFGDDTFARDVDVDDEDDETTGLEITEDVEMEPEGSQDGVEQEEEPVIVEFDPSAHGLKEISNLANFSVSSYKPGCGVAQLRDESVNYFWQSDGPQPHELNIHFIKRVEIRALRLYLDYELDESYTPTKIKITAGFSPNMTIPFRTMELTMPKGWIDVPIEGAGGGPDKNSLCCFFVRVIVHENHQNGKDTHIRGVKVYAFDEDADTADNNPIDDVMDTIEDRGQDAFDEDEVPQRKSRGKRYTPGDGGLTIPDFMREPEIR